jgi:hypothetical protein
MYALSNGLLRMNGVDWLDKVQYFEHLVYDIEGKSIKKFYPLDFIDKTVIVSTEKTVKSILDNFEYFKEIGLFTDKFFIKIMNQKTHSIIPFLKDISLLYHKLKDKYHIDMIRSISNSAYDNKRMCCMRNPPHSFIDFEKKQLGHCAIFFDRSKTVDFSKESLNKLLVCDLFKDCDYCFNCYNFDNGLDKFKFILDSRNGEYKNRSFNQ